MHYALCQQVQIRIDLKNIKTLYKTHETDAKSIDTI